jgi:uncharacterized membrane protein YesL
MILFINDAYLLEEKMSDSNGGNSLFDQNRLIWVIANRVADVLAVALLWLLFSLPVVTIGASSTAAYYVYLKMARKEDGYIWRNFIKSFKQNFMQATVLWLLQAAIGAGLGLAAYYYYVQETVVSAGIYAFLGGMMIVVLMVCIYLPPVVCRFSNKTFVLLKTAMFMPFKHFKWTLVLVVLFLAFAFIGWFVIPFVIIVYGVYAYVSSFIFVRIFKPYEDEIRKREGYAAEAEGRNKEKEENKGDRRK